MSVSKLRNDALTIFQAGLQAANPVEAVEKQVRRDGDTLFVAGKPYPLRSVRGVRLVGMGKASARATRAL